MGLRIQFGTLCEGKEVTLPILDGTRVRVVQENTTAERLALSVNNEEYYQGPLVVPTINTCGPKIVEQCFMEDTSSGSCVCEIFVRQEIVKERVVDVSAGRVRSWQARQDVRHVLVRPLSQAVSRYGSREV